MTEWFEEWFGEEYLQLYPHRDVAEADRAVALILDRTGFATGWRVLDVACGAGNCAIAAARRLGDAVGLDYVPALLERGRERAAAERYDIEFVEGDAQALPFEDASFDVVLSTFGAMFAPDQERTAQEILRVCRSGGKIGMANWPPRGLVGGGVFKVVAEHAPPPPGVQPPVLWGRRSDSASSSATAPPSWK
jgi:ubiquinone/menaquinone biosynthesis C-methylase UbiE